MVLDIEAILEKIEKWNTNRKVKARERQLRADDALVKAIELHVDILELTRMLAVIMSGILFIIIANSILFMAIGLIQMETKTKAAAFEVYVSLNSVMLQSALIWFFCYHSSLVSIRMNEISHSAYSTPWYKLAVHSQKCVLLMVQRSNQNLVNSGFGIMPCDLQTLRMIINSVVSYYLLLKRV